MSITLMMMMMMMMMVMRSNRRRRGRGVNHIWWRYRLFPLFSFCRFFTARSTLIQFCLHSWLYFQKAQQALTNHGPRETFQKEWWDQVKKMVGPSEKGRSHLVEEERPATPTDILKHQNCQQNGLILSSTSSPPPWSWSWSSLLLLLLLLLLVLLLVMTCVIPWMASRSPGHMCLLASTRNPRTPMFIWSFIIIMLTS